MTITRIIRTFAATAAIGLFVATPALAHEGAMGDGGPFKIEIATPDPTGVETRWGNGEVEFHVETGVEVVVFGVEKEPMVKVAQDGAMFVNENSPSWWLNQPEGSIPANASAAAEPNWVWKMSGGSMQFHDHRFHFMQGSIPADTQDGDKIFEFGLPVTVNGEALEMRGAFIFDSTIDPAAAERLKAGDIPVDATNGSEGGSGSSTIIIVGVIAVVLAIGGAVARKMRR